MFENLLSERGLSLDRLRNFCEIASKGSIAQAAGAELSRQSLYSRQVSELEEFFGVELTRRKGKGLEITKAGYKLAAAARSQLQALEDFKTECANEPLDFRIAAGNSILEWMLIPSLAQLRETIGMQRIHLYTMRSRDVVAGLIDHTVDFGIIRKTAVVPPLKFKALCELDYALFYPSAWKTISSKAQLQQTSIAIPEGGEFFGAVQSLAAKQKLSLQISYYCTSHTQASQLVRMGVSAAILPRIAERSLAGSARLHELPWLAPYRRPIGLVWHQRLISIRPKAETLLNASCEILQGKATE